MSDHQSFDDASLTAYVLGELDDAERARVEAHLRTNPEANAFVNDLRRLTQDLEASLGEESPEGLADDQRASIETRLAEMESPPVRRLPMRPLAWAATFLVAAAGVWAWTTRSPSEATEEPAELADTTTTSDELTTTTNHRFFGVDTEQTVQAADESQLGLVATEEAEKELSKLQASSIDELQALEDQHLWVLGTGGEQTKGEELWKGNTTQFLLKDHLAVDPSQYFFTPGSGDQPTEASIRRLRSKLPAGSQADDSISLYALGVETPFGSELSLSESLVAQGEAKTHDMYMVDGAVDTPVDALELRFEVDVDLDVLADDIHVEQARGESYAPLEALPFILVGDDPRSTFSIDVDTASYSNVRRFLEQGQRPPPDAVRIEEFVNYFNYDYSQPTDEHPFSVTQEVATCPWNPEHRLVHVGLQGKELGDEPLPPCNLVFLLDVSGSMSSQNKLPLVKQSIALLAEHLRPQDRVAMAVYAGSSGLVLDSVDGQQQAEIVAALDALSAGGSTAGAEGIELAYQVAERHFIEGGINRVMLATDGDFNVGISDTNELLKLIEEKSKTGVFLTVLGYGMGNLQDHRLEQIANHGNGHYAYIDDLDEARRVLVDERGATLHTIAKDVKIQVEFNPTRVESFRLLGYENRRLEHHQFNDDRIDAGEIGSGHTVTALYEIVPVGASTQIGANVAAADGLKYQEQSPSPAAHSGELMTVKLRYKQPDATESHLLERTVDDSDVAVWRSSVDYRFSAAVTAFAMVLRGGNDAEGLTLALVEELAAEVVDTEATDAESVKRAEFLDLVRKAREVMGQ